MRGSNFSGKAFLVKVFLLTTTFAIVFATPTRFSGNPQQPVQKDQLYEKSYEKPYGNGNLQATNDLYDPNPNQSKLNLVDDDANKYNILGQNGNRELDLDYLESLRARITQNMEIRQNFESVTFQNMYFTDPDKCKMKMEFTFTYNGMFGKCIDFVSLCGNFKSCIKVGGKGDWCVLNEFCSMGKQQEKA